jgi:hypothetical protein
VSQKPANSKKLKNATDDHESLKYVFDACHQMLVSLEKSRTGRRELGITRQLVATAQTALSDVSKKYKRRLEVKVDGLLEARRRRLEARIAYVKELEELIRGQLDLAAAQVRALSKPS